MTNVPMKKTTAVIIATFSPWKNGIRETTNGMIEPMLSYFVPRAKDIYLIDQPYPGSDRIVPVLEEYENGRLKRKIKLSVFCLLLYPLLCLENSPGTKLSFKMRDFLSIIECALRNVRKFDLFIGLESINTLAGILLKKLGLVSTVVYYVSDYSPNRYPSNIANSVYLWLDRFCATHADFIWDVSSAMQPARIKAGLNPKTSVRVIHVPNALFKEQITFVPLSETKPYTAVFAGTLGEENGPDIAITAFRKVVQRFPAAKLHIIGGGEEEHVLKNLAFNLGIENNVIFHGFISDTKELSRKIKYFQIGLAPYKQIPGTPRLYGDATKIRLYLAAGLPVLTTHVPPLGKEVQQKKAGVLVNDNPEAFANGITELFSHTKKMQQMKHNALATAQNNTWENTYQHALDEMNITLHHQ